MRHLVPSLAGLIVLAAPLAADARPYYVIQTGGEGWTVMDPQGVETAAGSPVKKAWAVRVQRNILSSGPPQPGYVRTLSEYDCVAQRTRWREFSAFSRSGKLLISKVNPQPEWAPATEDSEAYAAYRVVCEGVGGGSIVSADSVAKVVISLMGAWDPPGQPAATVPDPAPAQPDPAGKPPSGAAKPGPAKAKAAANTTVGAKPAAAPASAKTAPNPK
jgi:hypothetical protein